MCLGMANGYREPKKINETSNVAEVTQTLQRILEVSNEPIGDNFFANITTKTIKDVLEVLTLQQAEIEDARISVKSYKGKYESAVETARELKLVIAEKQAEIDRLKNENLIKNLINEQKTSSATEEQLPTEVSQKISIYEFAEGLNGRQRGKEIYPAEKQLAKELGFVVVFGYSDDCAEFCGAYEEEVDCFDGGRVYEDGDKYIDAVWCGNNGYDWTYNTNIEHTTFDIYEDEVDKYCRGIVFKK